MKQTLAIASDHAGFQMKQKLIQYLEEKKFTIRDLGTNSLESVDYPDYGHPLATGVETGLYSMGFSLCGSGNGINMVTNKHQGIRGALCWNKDISMLARKHNNANICSIPARFVSFEEAIEICDVFLSTEFEGGRHQARIDQIPI